VREFATDAMMALIREDLALLGVEMDVFYSEKSLYGTGRIEAAIDDLKAKGLIYEGVLEPPKGKTPEDWEPRVQTLFKSTEYGDDVDRPVMKSDGAWTYFAPDIAYHYDKVSRGFDELIDIFGADHGGYVKRMKAAVAALSEERVPLDIKLMQLVKLNGATRN
jgi:arginyl-tRNA synthetase